MTVDAVGGARAVRNSWEKDNEGRLNIEDSLQVKKNKKFRGDVKYKKGFELQEESESIEEVEEEIEIVKRKSKNSW